VVSLNSPARQSSASSIKRVLPILFFFSGASSLIFETIFTRLLTYTFGNTAYAVSTVLAAFLGGLALGAYVLGRYADRLYPSMWIYGTLELLVAIYALFIPRLFALLTEIYVGVYHYFHLGPAELSATRFALASVVILVPTFLMGGTLPVLARFVAAGHLDIQQQVSRLYAWNTLGAALGTLASTYLLMPTLGVWGTILTACGINVTLFISVAALARRLSLNFAPHEPVPEMKSKPVPTALGQPVGYSRKLLALAAFLTGAVALAYEVLWTHVLSFLIGNTVYAFGVMLFTFLCGLGLGARFVSHRLKGQALWTTVLAASQLLLGFFVLVTLPIWNLIPEAFKGGYPQALELDVVAIALMIVCHMATAVWNIYRRPAQGRFPWRRVVGLAIEAVLLFAVLNVNTSLIIKYESTYFAAGELLRFLCAFYLLIIPSFLLGVGFPLLLNLSSGPFEQAGRSVGGVYAANTMGAILGSVITGFFLLPRFGSFAALKTAAAANLVLGLWFALQWVPLHRTRKLILVMGTASLFVIFWHGLRGWDVREMTRGSYVYFNAGWPIDQVLYFKEDVQGGLTSVVQVGPTRVLLSNGKFQGNNTGEVAEQIGFATIPVLFTGEFNKALVIGLGTGNTLHAVSHFPFKRIDAVELAPSIVDAAREWFDDVNERVFDRDPRIKLSIADGRNFLLLSRDHYDLVTIEVSSIWISGEADLYNKEFYELCKAHMTEHGVLQQWVQIHHMRTADFLVILNTAAHVFPHSAFFLGREQGLLVASPSPLSIDARQIRGLDADPATQEELKVLRVTSMATLLGGLMLQGESMHRALALLPQTSGLPADFVSSDYFPYLEYQTPKGNALPYDTFYLNRQLMENLRPPPIPPGLPIRNLSSDDERNLWAAYATEGRGDLSGALELFRRVHGRDLPRAESEIAGIEAKLKQPGH
jgi:spermidine synthase